VCVVNKFPHFTKPDSLLQFSQDPSSVPCPEPVQSISCPYILFNICLNIILSQFCVFQVLSSVQDIQLKYGTNFSSTHGFEVKYVYA
jgi:hypothetical protein